MVHGKPKTSLVAMEAGMLWTGIPGSLSKNLVEGGEGARSRVGGVNFHIYKMNPSLQIREGTLH